MHAHTQRRLVEKLFNTRHSRELESMMRVDSVSARAIFARSREGADIVFAWDY